MQSMIRRPLVISALALVVAGLSACGGDGGDDSAAPTAFGAQGGWSGTSSGGDIVDALVLEDGSIWAFSGTETSGGVFVDALYQGTLQSNGSSLTSSDMRGFDIESGDAVALTASGSYSATTLNLTVSAGGNTDSVTASPSPSANYDYNQLAQLSALAGNWPGFFTTGDDGTVTVQSNGQFSTTTSAGCAISGTATPRPSGKNVFNINLNFGPAPCLLPNGTASGVGVITHPTTSSSQLAVLVTNAARDSAAAFFGSR